MPDNKSKNNNKKSTGKPSTSRHNFAAMKKVKEARAKSPLKPEEQVRLIREFTAWDDVPPADVDELISALMGESYTLGGTTYLAPDDYQFVQDLMNDPAPKKVSWASESLTDDSNQSSNEENTETGNDASDTDGARTHVDLKENSNEPTSTVKTDESTSPSDSTPTVSATVTLKSDDTDSDTPNDNDGIPPENPDDTEESLEDDGDSLADSIESTFKSIGGLFDEFRNKVHESWVDWTADVRVPVEEDVDNEDSDKPTEMTNNTPVGMTLTGKSSRKSSIDDYNVTTDSDRITTDGYEIVEEKEFHVPNPLNGLKAIKSVAGSFVDGVAGRPIRTKFVMSPTASNDKKAPEWRTALKWIMRVLAVIGGIALVRAALDAFRPRR